MERRTSKFATRTETPSWYVAKRIIRAHGISYKELGERMNLSVTTIHSLVNYAPSIMHVKMMADAIGCSFFDFFDFSADPNASQAVLSSISGIHVNAPADNIFMCPSCNQKFAIVPINAEDDMEKDESEGKEQEEGVETGNV